MTSTAKKNDLILILGMHRSGTSALTRMINLLGANLGKQLITAKAEVNDKGFWENSKLVEINEHLLNILHSGWFDYSGFPDQWWNENRMKPIKEAVTKFLHREFESSELGALKDPRLCRLLPLWCDVIHQTNLQAKILLVLRNPAEVRRSLLKRDPFSPLTADLLWLTYVADAEKNSQHMPRCWVDYDELLNNWRDLATRIAKDLKLDWPVPIEKISSTIDLEIDPKLRHHYLDQNEENSCKSPISDDLQEIYAEISQGKILTFTNQTLEKIHTLLSSHQSYAKTIFNLNCQLAKTTSSEHLIGQQLQHARDIIAQREQEKSQTEAQLTRLGSEHQQALSVLKERDEQLRQQHAEFHQLESWSKEIEETAKTNWAKYEETEIRHNKTIEELHQHLRKTHEKLQLSHDQNLQTHHKLDQALAKLAQFTHHRLIGPLSRAFKLINKS